MSDTIRENVPIVAQRQLPAYFVNETTDRDFFRESLAMDIGKQLMDGGLINFDERLTKTGVLEFTATYNHRHTTKRGDINE